MALGPNNLFKLFHFPTKRWTLVDTYDLGEQALVCEACDHAHIRYVHVLEHARFNRKIEVGCVCAEALCATSKAVLASRKTAAHTHRKHQLQVAAAWQSFAAQLFATPQTIGGPLKSGKAFYIAPTGQLLTYTVGRNRTILHNGYGEGLILAFATVVGLRLSKTKAFQDFIRDRKADGSIPPLVPYVAPPPPQPVSARLSAMKQRIQNILNGEPSR